MKPETFEYFLQVKHLEERGHLVPKDDLPDDFNDWVCLDADTFIKYAQQWGDEEKLKIINRIKSALHD